MFNLDQTNVGPHVESYHIAFGACIDRNLFNLDRVRALTAAQDGYRKKNWKREVS